ncbi:MAG: hypothetical protein Q7T50_07440 [Candidatus Magasanikbacteria bacterium]|nr:hypothetical protein [Candidatus Magasanikbacteria bacterium]
MTKKESNEMVLKYVSEMCAEMLDSSNIIIRLLGKIHQYKDSLGMEIPEIVGLIVQNHLEPFEEVLKNGMLFCGVDYKEMEKAISSLEKTLKGKLDSKSEKCFCGRTCGCARSLQGLTLKEASLILPTD